MNGFSFDDFVARQKKLKDFSSLLQHVSTCPAEQWGALFQEQKDLLSELRQDVMPDVFAAISDHGPSSADDMHLLLCAVFDHDPLHPWPPKKANHFLHHLVLLHAYMGDQPPQGNVQSFYALSDMVSRIIPPFKPDGTFNGQSMSVYEKLISQYTADFSFALMPFLCKILGDNPRVVHMAYKHLIKRPESDPHWQEVVNILHPVAQAYEDRVTLEKELSAKMSNATPSVKVLKI